MIILSLVLIFSVYCFFAVDINKAQARSFICMVCDNVIEYNAGETLGIREWSNLVLILNQKLVTLYTMMVAEGC